MKNWVFAMALLLLSSLAFSAPIILSPDQDGGSQVYYNYEPCAGIEFKWDSSADAGYSGTYYLFTTFEGSDYLLAALLDDGNKNTLFSFGVPWEFVETFTDGRYYWHVCNDAGMVDCADGIMDKQMNITRLTPADGSTVTQNTVFTWQKKSSAKNYFAKAYGGILGTIANPFYFALGDTNSFALSPFYSLLSFGENYYWNVYATCDTNLTPAEMLAYSPASVTGYWNFKK